MILQCQKESYNTLVDFAKKSCHSICIEGSQGSGKTHLAKEYAKLLKIPDFHIISPKTEAIRDIVSSANSTQFPIVFCIENLDDGVMSASSAILKFLEEPSVNTYIIITCRNIYHIPDTIVSRSLCVTLSNPHIEDINKLADSIDRSKYEYLSKTNLWKCINNLSDVKTVMDLSPEQIGYFDTATQTLLDNKLSVSDIIWRIGHYPDNKPTPIIFLLQYAMYNTDNPFIRNFILQALNELHNQRLASHLVLAKLVMDIQFLSERRVH